ncbi:peroxisomal 3,2-trans-enoyl-CoA isomerase [Pseudohyphozyma bogoriensis]|nr:peroxisomal 3,2-trans-enoyl-CoA isomerase [Pseudohyphozyma bogoriensis]
MPPTRNSRVRNPSFRAIEAEQASIHAAEAAAARRRNPPPRKRAAPTASAKGKAPPAAKGKGKAKATAGTSETPAAAPAPKAPVRGRRTGTSAGPSAKAEEDDDGEPDLTLYCICLGFDTGGPMIQCQHCSNCCIGMDEEDANTIEAYSCALCEDMGSGRTKRTTDATAQSPSTNADDDEEQDFGDAIMSPVSVSGEATLAPADAPAPAEDDEMEPVPQPTRKRKMPPGVKPRTRRKVSAQEPEPEPEPKPENEQEDEDEEELLDKDDEDYVGDEELALRDKKGKSKSVEPTSFYEAEEEDSPKASTKGGRTRKPSVAAGTSGSPPATPDVVVSSTPATDKTRSHCITQLTNFFKSILSASDDDSDSIGVQARAAAFAENVEGELFDSFGEVDAKNVKGPRAKYTTKFRSLSFNLKTNANFRSRISANDLSPSQIVNMSNEDLMTPELKAMAEKVRSASLKNSMREVIAAPTAKRTHKGEEEIESSAAVQGAGEISKDLAERERRAAEKRERSGSLAHGSPSATNYGSPTPSASHYSPRAQGSPRFDSPVPMHSPFGSPPREGSPFAPRSPVVDPADLADANVKPLETSDKVASPAPGSSKPVGDDESKSALASLSFTTADLGFEDSDSGTPLRASTPVKAEEEKKGAKEGQMLPPPARSRASLDMASVWNQIKPSPTLASSEQLESSYTDEGSLAASGGQEEVEVFSMKDAEGFDTFESTGDEPSQRSTTPTGSPPPPTSSESLLSTTLLKLDHVYEGDLIVPEEGGFPAIGVQIGGRPLGNHPDVWSQIIPPGLNMEGRIQTSVATKFLIDCSFSNSRELVVLGILPDVSGPSAAFPHKPAPASCLKKYAHIVDFYVNKDRVGVVGIPEAMKRLVKDFYVVPLRKDAPLPEFIELMDDHHIPETGHRDNDLLLCVLVVQKGAIQPRAAPPPPPPTTLPPAYVPPLTSQAQPPTSAPPPSSSAPWNASPPATSTAMFSGLDPAALQSLHNMLNQAPHKRLALLINTVDKMEEVFLTILTGKGDFFSAGANVKSTREDIGSGDIHSSSLSRLSQGNMDLGRALYTHSKILVAALNGPAIGLSAALLGWFDFVYAVEKAYLLTPFSTLSLVAEGGASMCFPRRMGLAKANEALIMGKKLTSAELLQANFVNEVFPTSTDSVFLAKVVEYLHDKFDHLDKEACQITKSLIRQTLPDPESTNIREIFAGVERFKTGKPQAEFAKFANKTKRHKL